MPLSPARYDGHAEWYESVDDVTAVLAEASRVLTPGGVLVFYGAHPCLRHHPLAELLNAFTGAGLPIERVAERSDRPVPAALAIRARKPAPAG